MSDSGVVVPRLSPTVAKALLRCPAEAWRIHRMLGGERDAPTPAMVDGLVMEHCILGGDDRLAVIDAPDYRSASAREARDAALASGLTPVLRSRLDACAVAAVVIRDRIAEAVGSDLYSRLCSASIQHRIEWDDSETSCACVGVLDALHIADHDAVIFDLKSVSDAHPDNVVNAAYRGGWHLQAAAYRSAVLHDAGIELTKMIFVCFEREHPHYVSCVTLSREWMEMGDSLWRRACAVWRECVARGSWSSYSARGVIELDAAPWQLRAMQECALEDVIDA